MYPTSITIYLKNRKSAETATHHVIAYIEEAENREVSLALS